MTSNQALKDLHILVTRPEGLADILCDNITRLGGKATHFPVIQICDPDKNQSRQYIIDSINEYDIAVFISPTSVTKTLEWVKPSALKLTIAAIGESTCSSLERLNIAVGIRSQGNNSETLLQHPDLQTHNVKNKKIVIFKGEGGRTLLSDTLSSRGATVFNAIMYQRIQPGDYVPLSQPFLESLNYILVSSGEGLTNLINMVDDKDKLLDIKTLVPGKRCASLARQLGFRSIIETENATNACYINTLLTQP